MNTSNGNCVSDVTSSVTDDLKSARAIGFPGRFKARIIKPKKGVRMLFDGDIFKILSFAVRVIRIIFEIFGDQKDKEMVTKSKERSVNKSEDEPC